MFSYLLSASDLSEVCSEGSLRLVDGDIAQEGYLEMCSNSVWGRICSYGWGTTDSYVACKGLGYQPNTGIGACVEDYMNACVYKHYSHQLIVCSSSTFEFSVG